MKKRKKEKKKEKKKEEERNKSREEESLEDFVFKLLIIFLSPNVKLSAVPCCWFCCRGFWGVGVESGGNLTLTPHLITLHKPIVNSEML